MAGIVGAERIFRGEHTVEGDAELWRGGGFGDHADARAARVVEAARKRMAAPSRASALALGSSSTHQSSSWVMDEVR